MATIDLYALYKNKLRKFGLLESDRFANAFVEAVNLAYIEMNSQVFQSQTLNQIGSFDDIIDTRLRSFSTLTFDSDSNEAISSREFWKIEYEFERTSDTNGFTDTITDDASNVVVSILNGVLTITGDSVTGSLTLPDESVATILLESYSEGIRVTVNETEYSLEYSSGNQGDTQGIGIVSSRVFSGISGYELTRTRFLTESTLIYDFLLNEGTGLSVTDEISEFTGTLVSAEWNTRYIEPSSGLGVEFLAPFSMAIDYHLQDGNEWSIEPEAERERKWYGRGINMARNINQQNTDYVGQLGIE